MHARSADKSNGTLVTVLPPRPLVYMFVMNNCAHDARVLKEARSLTQAGYHVTIIAVLDRTTEPYEIKDGFEIARVIKDPLHYKLLRTSRRAKRLPRQVVISLYKEIRRLLKILVGSGTKKLYQKSDTGTTRVLSIIKKGLLGTAAIVSSPFRFFFFVTQQSGRFLRKRILARVEKHAIAVVMLFHKPLSFLDYYIRAYRIVRSSPGDIYHAHDLNTLPVAWWAKKKLGGKLVYDSHELYVERNTVRPERAIWKWFLSRGEAFLIRRADAVITVGEMISAELAKRYRIQAPSVVRNTPLHHVRSYDGMPKSLRASLSISDKYYLLLYAGGITFNRGLEKVIESLSYLSDCELVLMGYGSPEYKMKLRKLAEEFGVEKRFSFFGPVPSDEVVAYVASADVGIAAIENVCLSYYYCLPNKLFEYIAAGIPVAASAFPELKKIIEEQGIGVTFDPEDPKDIARAIRSILDNAEARERMRANARKAAMLYNWQREEKKLIEIYRSLDK